MAKHSNDILALARRGAQQRYDELVAELEGLARQFPGLTAGARRGATRGRNPGPAAAAEPQPRRKRRKMSAAARKAISEAQKKRWAKQKSAKA